MANILMIGAGPLPEPESKWCGAAVLRTWQMARPLLESPHNFRLLALPDGAAGAPSKERSLEYDGFFYTMLPQGDLEALSAQVERAVESFAPDCLVAVGQTAAFVASQVPTRLPLWADLPGMSLAAAQLRASEAASDAPLEAAWARERTILLRADKFSAASMPQLHALMGELALAGRMNHLTAQYHFAHHIPDAVHPFFTRMPSTAQGPLTLRRDKIPSDAFLVLWSGGFGAAFDHETLGEALERAMALNPRIHFVCTGGDGPDDSAGGYSRFVSAAQAGPYAARHHFLGRVEMGRLPQIYRECNLGLCIDGMNYETLFGTRARMLNMMAVGLPVLATLGTELSHVMREEAIGLVAPACDDEALAEAIVKASRSVQDVHTMGQKARTYVTRQFAATSVCRALREWVDEAEAAPDNARKAASLGDGDLLQSWALNGIQAYLVEENESNGRGAFDQGPAKKLFRGLSQRTLNLIRRK